MAASADFITVFDLSQSGFTDWSFSGAGLILTAASLGFIFAPQILKLLNKPSSKYETNSRKVFGYIFLAFASVWTLASFTSTYSQYRKLRDLLVQGECKIVEGPV